MWYKNMFIALENEKDEERAAQMSAYMKNKFPFLGIPRPTDKNS
jgi:3-methyladenine DNA glycosylase AlkD